jgi:predicted XRE-type DNA-binding protein
MAGTGKKMKVHKSGESVFADIGVKNPQSAQLRSEVMTLITRIIESRGLTQAQIASQLHLTQPQVSYLMNGKLSKFSLERLFEILNDLHQDVKIIVARTKLKKSGTLQIKELAA